MLIDGIAQRTNRLFVHSGIHAAGRTFNARTDMFTNGIDTIHFFRNTKFTQRFFCVILNIDALVFSCDGQTHGVDSPAILQKHAVFVQCTMNPLWVVKGAPSGNSDSTKMALDSVAPSLPEKSGEGKILKMSIKTYYV